MPRTKEVFEAMRETTRQKIVTAALSLFAKNGLSVKVGEIAGSGGTAATRTLSTLSPDILTG